MAKLPTWLNLSLYWNVKFMPHFTKIQREPTTKLKKKKLCSSTTLPTQPHHFSHSAVFHLPQEEWVTCNSLSDLEMCALTDLFTCLQHIISEDFHFTCDLKTGDSLLMRFIKFSHVLFICPLRDCYSSKPLQKHLWPIYSKDAHRWTKYKFMGAAVVFGKLPQRGWHILGPYCHMRQDFGLSHAPERKWQSQEWCMPTLTENSSATKLY
jgi:hypothetical protein